MRGTRAKRLRWAGAPNPGRKHGGTPKVLAAAIAAAESDPDGCPDCGRVPCECDAVAS